MPRSRSSLQSLARLFDSSVFPIYALDEEREIVFCNEACCEWLGVSADRLLGVRCQYHSQPDVPEAAAVAAGLCPPPAVFGGLRQTAEVSCVARDGQSRRRRGEFLPLAEGSDGSAGVLVVLGLADCEEGTAPPACDSLAPSSLHEQLRRFRHEAADRHAPDSLVGGSPAIARAKAQIALAASSQVSVLIVGPSGSGKEHVAKAIHYRSPSAATRALVPLACAVLGGELLSSTVSALLSKQATADRGATLLLGDVDELPAEIQAEMIRLLKNPPPGLRVLSTAARPLEDLVREDRFRGELACLLSTVRIDLPALAQRLEDLPLLAQLFLEAVNARSGKRLGNKQIGGFTPAALDRLAAHSWPGNLDELAQIVEQAHARCHSSLVDSSDLPDRLQLAAAAARHSRRDEAIALEEFLAGVETELIQRALRRAKGNKSKAAKLLGLTRPRLYRRLVQLGLEPGAQTDEEVVQFTEENLTNSDEGLMTND